MVSFGLETMFALQVPHLVVWTDGRLGIYLYCVKLKVFLLCIMENIIVFIISSILSWVDENPWIDLGIIETSDNAQSAFL